MCSALSPGQRRVVVSTNQSPYLASLLHMSNIPMQLRSFISQELFVPKTKVYLGMLAFPVAAPEIWNDDRCLTILICRASEFGFLMI